MYDSFGRQISYLRISVTDRCNLRCFYCLPENGVELRSHAEMLTYEEIARLAAIGAEEGLKHIRLTGGEPLVRPQLPALVRMLAAIPGIQEVSMTTNAVLLARFASPLAEAGLRRVNVSLDTLRPERFRRICRGGDLQFVLEGIEAAERAGLSPIKINVVAMRGFNDDEFADLAALTMKHRWHLRFIELMPVGEARKLYGAHFISRQEIERQLSSAFGPLEPEGETAPIGHGPAQSYRLPGGRGTVGFVAAVSEHVCSRCNRMRLTADGRLRPCLFSDREIDLRPALRSDASTEELKRLYREAVTLKPERHWLSEGRQPQRRVMSQIGG